MKITIDKTYTSGCFKDRVKEDIKTFREVYTESDLLRAYNDTFDEYIAGWKDNILKCELQAFPGGTDYNNETWFYCEMVIDCEVAIFKIRFFCDLHLKIDTRDGMHKTRYFKETELKR